MNNRQSGRRRGRGGQRPQGGPGRPEQGNRIDNRARGNASQLLEKYKALARDAQTQGDRVMTEYYLQFADHYFRVLSESRARFDENQPRRGRDDFQDDEDDGEELRGDAGADADDGDSDRQPQFNDRSDRAPRQERPRRDDREPREAREPRESRESREPREPRERRPRHEPVRAEAEPVVEQPQPSEDKAPARAPRGNLRPRRNGTANGHAVAEANGIDADRLPPSFNFAEEQPVSAAEVEAEAAPAPKRRGRPRKVVEAPAEG
jgi:hypothetical protein